MYISTTQINIQAVKVDYNCDAVSLQGNPDPSTAKDFTAVLQAILSGLNKTGLLTNQEGQSLDINELTKGLLSGKDVNAGQDMSLSDLLQQVMAQLTGMAQPLIVNVTPDEPVVCMAGNSDVSMGAHNGPVLMVKPGNAANNPIQTNSGKPDFVSEIKPEVKAEIKNDVNSLLPQSQEQSEALQLSGLKNTGDQLLQSKNDLPKNNNKTEIQKNVSNVISDNITAVANSNKVKLEGMEPDFNNDLMSQNGRSALNEEQSAFNSLKVTGIETDGGARELNNPVPAVAHHHQAEYGKNAISSAKETVHISRLSELSEPIAKNLGSGNNHLTIKLTPPELGDIQIKLRMENGVLKVDFKVDSSAVKELFSSAIPHIKASLEDSGIKSGDFYVNLKKDGYYSDGREQQSADNFNKQQQKQQRKSGSQFYDFFA